jgi:hypothetical protein
MTYLHTPANRLFRRNMWYFTRGVQMFIAAPFLLLFVMGCIAVDTVAPKLVGLGMMFAVPALGLIAYGFALWILNGWRMMRSVAWMFAGGMLLLLFYNVLVVFHDPAPFSLFAAAAAFLTLNMLGMVWIAFMNDPQLKKSFKQVIASLTKNQKMNVVRNKFKALGTMGLQFAAAAAAKANTEAVAQADNYWGACARCVCVCVCVCVFACYPRPRPRAPSSSALVPTPHTPHLSRANVCVRCRGGCRRRRRHGSRQGDGGGAVAQVAGRRAQEQEPVRGPRGRRVHDRPDALQRHVQLL